MPNLSDLEQQGSVQIGCQVSLEILYRNGRRESLSLDIVTDEKGDLNHGFLSSSTHLARAILGEKTGYIIPYFTEETISVEITLIQKSTRTPGADAHKKKKSKLNEIKDQIEFRDALLFASSSNTKWGEYDPDGMDFNTWISNQDQKDS